MASRRIALYPGSFDPVTNGHRDIIQRATRLFDHIIVAVGINSAKKSAFSTEERIRHLRLICKDLQNVEVATFSGLLANAVEDFSAVAVIRGLRAISDFEYEFQMALMNRELSERCETLFLMPRPKNLFVSSTMIREIARLDGDISPFVPTEICDEVKKRFTEA